MKNTDKKRYVIVGIAITTLFALTACSSAQSTKPASMTSSDAPTAAKQLEYTYKQYSDSYNKMSITIDKVAQTKFIQHKTSPSYVTQNAFYPYINASTTGSPILRLRIQYFASDWLFIQSYLLNVDGTQYTITPDEVQRDNGIVGGDSMIWEWYDYSLTNDEIAMLKVIADSKSAIIRSNGRQYYKDQTITSQQKQAIKDVLVEFDALKNNVDASPNGIALTTFQKLTEGYNAAGKVSSQAQFDFIVAHDYPNLLDVGLAKQCAMGQPPAQDGTSNDILNPEAKLTDPLGKGMLTFEYQLVADSLKEVPHDDFTIGHTGAKNYDPDVRAFSQSTNHPGANYSIKVSFKDWTEPGHVYRKSGSSTLFFTMLNGNAYMLESFC